MKIKTVESGIHWTQDYHLWGAHPLEGKSDTLDNDVTEINITLEGFASTRFMSVIYACKSQHCKVY